MLLTAFLVGRGAAGFPAAVPPLDPLQALQYE